MTYTPDDVRKAVNATRDEVLQRERETIATQIPDIPFIRDTMIEVLLVGDWLGKELERRGASDEEAESIVFAAGQRMVVSDPYEVGASVMNRYFDGDVDKPGRELADEVNAKLFGNKL